MEWVWASIPLSGAIWLGGPTCLCGYKWFSMSSCVPWDCSGLGGRLTPGPAVTGLLAELQPIVTFLISPPRPGPGTSGECRSPDTAGDCTPATLFTPKPEFPCGGGTKNLALFWLLPRWFWCWNLPTQECAWESVLLPKLRSADDGLQRDADRHAKGCRSFSWLLLDDSEFWPKHKYRKTDENDARKKIPDAKQKYADLERGFLVGLCCACNQAVVVWDGGWTDCENCLCPEKNVFSLNKC